MPFKSLVKPPRGINVMGGDMLEALLSLPERVSDEKKRHIALEKKLDEALDSGKLLIAHFRIILTMKILPLIHRP